MRGARAGALRHRGDRQQGLEPVNGVFEGLMDPTAVDISGDALYYLCGPLSFIQAVRSRLIEHGVAPHDIQYEVFGPDLWQADLD